MNTKLLIELFGYLGSALVVISMLMSSVFRLRVINMIGSIIFAIYALIIKSYPTALMNFFLVGINIYHLMRLRKESKHYDMFEGTTKDGYLSFLLSYYKEDIAKFFPEFSGDMLKRDGCRVFMVCCDHETSGMMIGTRGKEKDSLDILLDYSTPTYRDCSVGQYLYKNLPDYGIRSIRYTGKNEDHIRYMEKMGSVKTEDGAWVKKL